MTEKQKITLQVTLEEKEHLRRIARTLGYTVPRGPDAGEGSISAMLRSIAAGEAIVIKGMVGK